MSLDYYNCEWLSDKEIKELNGISPDAIIIKRDAFNVFSWKEPMWPTKDKKEFVRIHKNEILEILNELKEDGEL